MSSLGSLVVSLAMNTASFVSDIGKVGQQLTRLTADAAKAGAAIGAGLGAAVPVITALVTDAINAADKMGEFSESIGVSVEAVSALGYAAAMSGSSQEQLQASLVKFSRIATDAAEGSKSAAAAFESIGVSATDASGNVRPVDDLLKDVADRFASYENGAQKSALAQQFFGKTGSELVPFLNQGREGIEGLSEEAEHLGVVLTGQAAKSAGEFNDVLDKLTFAKQGLGREIAKQLLPTLSNLTSRLFESAKESGGFAKAASVAATGVKIFVTAGTILVGTLQTIGEYLGGIGAAAVALFSGRFREAATIAAQTGADLRGNIEGTFGSINDIWAETGDAVVADAPATGKKIAAPLVVAADEAAAARAKLEAEAKKANDAARKFALDEVQRLRDAEKGRVEMLRSLSGQTAAAMEEFQRETIDDAFFSGELSAEQYDNAINRLYQIKSVAGEAATESNEFAKSLGMTFASSFEKAVIEGQKLRDVTKGLLQDILQLFIRKNITQPLTNAVGSFDFSSLLSFGGPKVGGGGVNPGMVYPVGERGVEWFAPNMPGQIIPNNAIGQGGGGQQTKVDITVVNNTGTPATGRVEQTGPNSFRVLLDAVRGALGAEIAQGQGLMVPIASRLGANPGAALRRRTVGG